MRLGWREMSANRSTPKRLHAFGEVLAQLWAKRQQTHPKASFRQLAAQVGITHSALLKWMRGDIYNPTAGVLAKLEDAFRVRKGGLSELVRRNQTNLKLTFPDGLAIVKGDHRDDQTPPLSHAAPRLEPWALLDRRATRRILKTADSLIDQLHRAFGEQAPGARVAPAKRVTRGRGRDRSTATGT